MLRFYTKFVVQRCIVCCDRRHLDKSTSDYIRNTGTRGGRIFVYLVTSTPQQMYVILLIYQYLYISELQIFSRLSMHNIKITAASQPTHRKPSTIFKLLWRQPNLASQVMSRGLSGWSGRYNSYVLRFYTKFVVQRCIVCCDRHHLDKSTSDYIRNTGTRGGRIFVTLVTSTPQQMYVILLIYQNLYISELQIFSRLSMHNIKITAAPQPTHGKPSAIFKILWRQPNLASQVMSRGLSG